MDNITHTLIGITQARLLSQKIDHPKIKKAVLWTSIAANNFPDLDFLVPHLTTHLGGGKIAYLLHHRGYTHTFLAVIPQGIATALIMAFIFKVKFKHLLSAGILGSLLHIFCDFWNEYGIHPYSPFYDRWYSGGFSFILEPLIWFLLLPWLIFHCENIHRKFAEISSGILLWIMLLLMWFSGIVPPEVSVGATGFLAACFAIQNLGFKQSVLNRLTLGGILLFLALNFSLSKVSMQRVHNEIDRLNPGARKIEMTTTPAPANPFCTRVMSSLLTKDQTYVARMAVIAHLPFLIEADECMPRVFRERTLPLAPVSGEVEPTQSRGFHWVGEFKAPWSEFIALEKRSCTFSLLLRFARFPFFTKADWLGGKTVIGDMRVDNEKRLSFSEFAIEDEDPVCPKVVPPWRTAYLDLISEHVATQTQ